MPAGGGTLDYTADGWRGVGMTSVCPSQVTLVTRRAERGWEESADMRRGRKNSAVEGGYRTLAERERVEIVEVSS